MANQIDETTSESSLNLIAYCNEIEYSANINFEMVKPISSNTTYVYENKRSYYERPNKIIYGDHDHCQIVNVIRVDGNEEPYEISTKFKVYKEKFECNEQKYSYTKSIELPTNDIDIKKMNKPCQKTLSIIYWHLLVDNIYVFRVAFRYNDIDKTTQCNVECETQSITREKFVRVFEFIKDHYVRQNATQTIIEPSSIEESSAEISIRIMTREVANVIDMSTNPHIDFDGKKLNIFQSKIFIINYLFFFDYRFHHEVCEKRNSNYSKSFSSLI